MAMNVVKVLSVILVLQTRAFSCILVNPNVTKLDENLIGLSRWYLPVSKQEIETTDSLNVVPLNSDIPKNHAKVYSPPFILTTKKSISDNRNNIWFKDPRIQKHSANISRSYAIERVPLLLNGHRYQNDNIKQVYETNENEGYPLNNNHDHVKLDTNRYSGGQSSSFINDAYWHYLTKAHYVPDEISAAIMTLDRFLGPLLASNGYNIHVHPPINPILSLILSRYGRYVPGSMNSRVYSYMATNNIHNHRPFGKYKLESEEEPVQY